MSFWVDLSIDGASLGHYDLAEFVINHFLSMFVCLVDDFVLSFCKNPHLLLRPNPGCAALIGRGTTASVFARWVGYSGLAHHIQKR